MVAGLACLEFLKLLGDHKKIERFKDTYINIALPFIAFSDPVAAKVTEVNNKKYTLWDTIKVEKDKTLGEFIHEVSDEFGADVDSVFYGTSIVYASFLGGKEENERKLKTMMSELLANHNPKLNKSEYQTLGVDVDFEDDEDAEKELPNIQYLLS